MKKISSLLLLLQLCIGVAAQSPDSLTFAVLGNSISTYYDYLPAGYAVYYTQDREKSVGFQVGDTWWMQLSRMSGLTFLANASWSGSRVAADELNSYAPFLSNHRVKALGRAGNPDLIFIAGGTNDWNVARVPLGEYRTSSFTDSVSFRGAYQRLLYKLTTRYPQARIVCLSIFPRGNGVNDKNAKGWSQADANASAAKAAVAILFMQALYQKAERRHEDDMSTSLLVVVRCTPRYAFQKFRRAQSRRTSCRLAHAFACV